MSRKKSGDESLFENSNDIDTVEAVRQGGDAGFDACDKMLQLQAQRLSRSLEKDFATFIMMLAVTVGPLAMEGDGLLLFAIFNHPFAPDDAENTGVFWPKPGVVKSGFDTTGEMQVEIHIVSNVGLQASVAEPANVIWGGSHQM